MLALFTSLVLSGALAGDPAFEDGLALYKASDYEVATLRFEEIAKRPDLTPADRATVSMWLGLCQAGIGDFEAAIAKLTDAVRADPAVALPANASPNIVAMFNEIKAREAAALAAAAAAAASTERPADPAAAPPAATTNSKEAGPNFVVVGSAAATGVGVLALAGGVVLAVLAANDYAIARDPDAFQTDAKAALDAGAAELTGAVVLLPLGALLTAGGGAMLALELVE